MEVVHKYTIVKTPKQKIYFYKTFEQKAVGRPKTIFSVVLLADLSWIENSLGHLIQIP
jgi:hypothetical protein